MRLAWVFLLVACTSAPSVPDAASIDASGADALGGTGTTCGGFANVPCDATHYCDFRNNGCGGDDSTGTGGTGGSTTDGGDASSNCGSVQCPAGKVCCNPVMSICADPGGVCAQ